MNVNEKWRMAVHVLLYGKYYTESFVVEGGVDTGPYSLTDRGFKWGELRLYMSPRGDVILTRRPAAYGQDPKAFWVVIFNSAWSERFCGPNDSPRLIRTMLEGLIQREVNKLHNLRRAELEARGSTVPELP